MEPRERRVPGGSSGTLCCVVTRSEQPASLARRVVAVLIDGVAVLVIWVFVWLAIRERLGLDVTSVASINAASAALYEVALIALFGQTVGKAAVGIAVVNASGENPAIWQSVVRYVVKTLAPLGSVWRWSGPDSRVLGALIIQAWEVLLLVSIVANGRRQGVHDRVGQTFVVNVKPRNPVTTEADAAGSLSRRLSGRGVPVPLVTIDQIRKRRIPPRR